MRGVGSIAMALALAACSLSDRALDTSMPAAATTDVLLSSTPQAGGTVKGPVEELVFRFAMPVRLIEVTVSGPNGLMPVMVEAAGETERYSIPVSGLEPGAYEVRWRASAAGREYAGGLGFSVR